MYPYRLTLIQQSFSDLRNQLVQHGEKYVEEALTYRQKIAQLSLAFIKDDSIVSDLPKSLIRFGSVMLEPCRFSPTPTRV